MPEKTIKTVFTFPSTHEAISMEKLAREEKLPGKMIPVPRAISASCGICWAVEENFADMISSSLEKHGIYSDGRYRLLIY